GAETSALALSILARLSRRADRGRTRLPDVLPCRHIAEPGALQPDGSGGCPHRTGPEAGWRQRDSLVRGGAGAPTARVGLGAAAVRAASQPEKQAVLIRGLGLALRLVGRLRGS